MIYCIECGKGLPDDANFCLRCGVPQTAAARLMDRAAPRWETARTRCKVVKKDRFSRICTCVLVLEAIGPQGTYIAEQSQPFQYYFGYDPLAHGAGFVPISENKTTRAAFDAFVAKIVGTGWEPMPISDSWYQYHFRRRLDALVTPVGPKLDTDL